MPSSPSTPAPTRLTPGPTDPRFERLTSDRFSSRSSRTFRSACPLFRRPTGSSMVVLTLVRSSSDATTPISRSSFTSPTTHGRTKPTFRLCVDQLPVSVCSTQLTSVPTRLRRPNGGGSDSQRNAIAHAQRLCAHLAEMPRMRPFRPCHGLHLREQVLGLRILFPNLVLERRGQ